MKGLCALLLCLLLLPGLACASSFATASWIANGNPVCSAGGDQISPMAVPDGAGGAIFAWRDFRAPAGGAYLQRVDGNGDVLWTVDGVRAASPVEESTPGIAPDGAGGAILVWMDYRAGYTNIDIYAQRVDANGGLLWGASGVPICQAIYHQLNPSIVSDGSGGAIIVWEDYRAIGGTADIYAQRVSPEGIVQWTVDGVVVCDAQLDQLLPIAAVDGSGGAVVVWNDYRDADLELFVQRIDPAGAALWTADGVGMFTAISARPFSGIVGDGLGGAIVVWTDSRSGEKDIYGQRIRADGALAWELNSIPICSVGGSTQITPVLAADGAGGAIVAWTDFRSGGVEVYAQRVDLDGNLLWEHLGVPVSEGWYPRIAADGQGGAVVAWETGYYPADIYGQRLGPNGEPIWTGEPAIGVPICQADLDQMNPRIVDDGSGGAIVVWQDARSGDWDIYAQRVDAAGHTVVATLLQSASATCSDGRVTIEWTLSEIDEGAEFRVLRSNGAEEVFREISSSSGIEREALSFQFVDESVEAGSVCRYRVDIVLGAERRELFTTDPVTVPAMPLALFQNHPNPFNPETVVPFYLSERGRVRLSVFDASGALVRRLFDGIRERGRYSEAWNGRDDGGRELASGVYFCRLEAGKSVLTRKMILLR